MPDPALAGRGSAPRRPPPLRRLPAADSGHARSSPSAKAARPSSAPAAIGPALGIDELYFKLESCNPTGSFKDRGMVVAVAKAMEDGAKAVLCASTGNTSASAAAYAAHCGLDAYVFLPRRQHRRRASSPRAVAYGAQIVAIEGNFDDALRLAREITREPPRRPRQLRQPLPHRRARRPPPSRSSTPSATRRTTSSSPSATPATSPPTGRASRSTPGRARHAARPA